MAPEQAAGRKDLDGRVDQFALGVIAYEMLTGSRRYASDATGNVISKLLRADPFPAPRDLQPSLSQALEAVVLRAIAHDREERFENVCDFGRALEEALGGTNDVGTLILPAGDAPDAGAANATPIPLQVEGLPARRSWRPLVAVSIALLLVPAVWVRIYPLGIRHRRHAPHLLFCHFGRVIGRWCGDLGGGLRL